jgi:formiminotetrahydrofolate cyclodeaminase
MALADTTIAELFDQLAARTPAPGGGAAAALAGAAAAALTEMAVAFALARADADGERLAATADRARELRVRLLELADADGRAYQPVLDALGMERENSRRAGALAAALSAAAEVPLEIAAAAAEVAELAAASVQAPGNEQLLGDAGAAAIIAEAATRAAVTLVELNLAGSPEDPRLRAAAALVQRAGEPTGIALKLVGPRSKRG